MMVVISETALEHLRAIREYIACNSPRNAKRVIDRIYRRFKQIEAFPEIGAVVERFGLPQIRQVVEGRYRIIYRIMPDGIEILAVRHGAQDWPNN